MNAALTGRDRLLLDTGVDTGSTLILIQLCMTRKMLQGGICAQNGSLKTSCKALLQAFCNNEYPISKRGTRGALITLPASGSSPRASFDLQVHVVIVRFVQSKRQHYESCFRDTAREGCHTTAPTPVCPVSSTWGLLGRSLIMYLFHIRIYQANNPWTVYILSRLLPPAWLSSVPMLFQRTIWLQW